MKISLYFTLIAFVLVAGSLPPAQQRIGAAIALVIGLLYWSGVLV